MKPETFRNYINGEWASGPTFENRNPANTDEVVGLFVKGSAADVEAAAEAAQAALAGWSSLPGPARGNILFKAADILDSAIETAFAKGRLRPMEFGGDQGSKAVTEQVMKTIEELAATR